MGAPHGGTAEGPAGPRRMSEARGATRCRGRVWLRDLPREASPAGHATGGMKGVPDHGAGARPAPTAQAKGGSKVRFEAHGWVRRSTAVLDSTAVRRDRSAKASDLGENLEGFLPRVSPTGPRPSPTQGLSDERPQDTTDYPQMVVSPST